MTLEFDKLPVAQGPFRLGDWLVEPRLNRLTRDGESIQIELKMMDVLVYLADRAGELVERQALIDTVWATEFISDGTLTRVVSRLRNVLGDDARNPSFIETIYGRGYRLMEPVQPHGKFSVMDSAQSLSFLAIARGIEFALDEGENLIGRAPDAAVSIPSMKVSRHHARIIVTNETAWLTDLGSKNGTYLNGTKIQESVEISGGDLIGVGCVTETVLVVDSLWRRTTESNSED